MTARLLLCLLGVAAAALLGSDRAEASARDDLCLAEYDFRDAAAFDQPERVWELLSPAAQARLGPTQAEFERGAARALHERLARYAGWRPTTRCAR